MKQVLKLKKCTTCKESKINAENYQRTPSGAYSKVCNDCRIVEVGKVKCISCNKRKPKTQFKEKTYKCNECVEESPMKRKRGAKSSTTRKCRKCGKQVKKTNFEVKESGRLSYACNRCRTLGMPKVTTKKTKEVEKHRVGSYEESHAMRLTAHEALAKAKQNEANLMRGGARYVKGNGVRMYVLSK